MIRILIYGNGLGSFPGASTLTNITVRGKNPSEIDIVVVGSAGSLLEQDLGSQIDEFEYIMRINQGKKFAHSYPESVGSRTDASFNKQSRGRLLQMRYHMHPVQTDGPVSPIKNEVFYDFEWDGDVRIPLMSNHVKPTENTYYAATIAKSSVIDRWDMSTYREFYVGREKVSQIGDNIYYVPRTYYGQGRAMLGARSPSTGFVCVITVITIFKSVTICGFDGFHTAHFYPKHKKDIGVRHPGASEMNIYAEWEGEGKIKILGKIKDDWENTFRDSPS